MGVLVGRGSVPTIIPSNISDPGVIRDSEPAPGPKVVKPTTKATPNLGFYKELKQKKPPSTTMPLTAATNPPPPTTLAKATVGSAKQARPQSSPTKAAKPEPVPTQPAKIKQPPTKPVVKPARPGYSLQVAAFKNGTEAEIYARRIQTRTGLKARVITVLIKGKGTWHRVRLGSFATRAEAVRQAARLGSLGLKPMIKAPGD